MANWNQGSSGFINFIGGTLFTVLVAACLGFYALLWITGIFIAAIAIVFMAIVIGICALLFRTLIVPFLSEETRISLCRPD